METATVEPRNDPMHEQNEREDPERERRLLAARPHTFAQEVRIERRERNDHDGGEDCEIGPKAKDGDSAGCCEQCDAGGDHEQACLKVSRDGHPLLYHFRGSEVVPHTTLDSTAAHARRNPHRSSTELRHAYESTQKYSTQHRRCRSWIPVRPHRSWNR